MIESCEYVCSGVPDAMALSGDLGPGAIDRCQMHSEIKSVFVALVTTLAKVFNLSLSFLPQQTTFAFSYSRQWRSQDFRKKNTPYMVGALFFFNNNNTSRMEENLEPYLMFNLKTCRGLLTLSVR